MNIASDNLNADDPDEDDRPSGVPTRVTACSSKAVAVVEDDVVLRGAICEVLRDAGLEPHPASTLPNARKILGVVHPCAIVLDLRLDGDDASLLLAELAREGVHVPVVVISADLSLLGKKRPPGTMVVLRKPFELDELVAAVLAAVVA